MIKKIKISHSTFDGYFYRQTKNRELIWKDCQFFLDDKERDYDGWVVFDSLRTRTVASCPKENVVLITGEPATVKRYNHSFLRQFSTVISSQSNINHPNLVISQQAIPWILSIYKNPSDNVPLDYDSFCLDNNFKKDKLLSVISSNKVNTKGHKQRYRFVQALKNSFGDKIDVFGKGVNTIPDKWEAIRPYKYHLALENSSTPHYWTEKLSDTFLANTYPIYHGCENIYEYFSKKSLSSINIENIEESIQQVKKIIKSNLFEKNRQHLLKAKMLVLNKYNFFEVVSQIVNLNKTYNKEIVAIKPEIEFLLKNRIISIKNKLWGKQ